MPFEIYFCLKMVVVLRSFLPGSDDGLTQSNFEIFSYLAECILILAYSCFAVPMKRKSGVDISVYMMKQMLFIVALSSIHSINKLGRLQKLLEILSSTIQML
jgi:hypothetical protein